MVAQILRAMVTSEEITMAGRIHPIAWHETAAELYERYRHEPDVRRRQRLQVLWLVRTSRTATAAAAESVVELRTRVALIDIG
jgi:hypothetical protein